MISKTILEEIKKYKVTMIVDTREQKNQHITQFLEEHKIPYIVKVLPFGDYAIMCKYRGLTLNGGLVVERKGSLNEFVGNICSDDRRRFETELKKAKLKKTKMMVVIEEVEGLDYMIHREQYRSKASKHAVIGTMRTFEARYNISFKTTDKKFSPSVIFLALWYHLREQLSILKELTDDK